MCVLCVCNVVLVDIVYNVRTWIIQHDTDLFNFNREDDPWETFCIGRQGEGGVVNA